MPETGARKSPREREQFARLGTSQKPERSNNNNNNSNSFQTRPAMSEHCAEQPGQSSSEWQELIAERWRPSKCLGPRLASEAGEREIRTTDRGQVSV